MVLGVEGIENTSLAGAQFYKADINCLTLAFHV